jgi:hypothetical protein
MCYQNEHLTRSSRRLISLWEIVKPFYPVIFTTLSAQFTIAEVGIIGTNSIISSVNRERILELIPKQRQRCADLGLIGSVATVDKIRSLVSKPNSTFAELHELGKELRGRLDDELFGTLFFSLDTSESEQYSNPTKDWEQVIKTWPKTQIDIEESSKCYACSRYAAAIFHVLLVAEFGVIEVAKLLGVAGDKPG